MTTLVTGAAGFLGSHVARLLAERGERVRVLVRPSSSRKALTDLQAEVVLGDLRNAQSLNAAMQGVRRVYHVAADYRLWARDPQEIYDSNVGGTRHLLDAAGRAGCERFVYTSTVATIAVHRPGQGVDGLPDERIATELGEMIGHYKRSKWLAEQEALAAAQRGVPVVIVNPTAPVGPGDAKPTPTGKLIVDFLSGRMPAFVDTGLNLVGVEDCAAGHVLAAEKGQVGERYILGARNMTLEEILRVLARITGLPAPRFRLPHAVAYAAGCVDTLFARILGREPRIPLEGVRMSRHRMFVDASRAVRELGFAPGPPEAALERAVNWYQANGFAPRLVARPAAA